jgi:hypothetical protein
MKFLYPIIFMLISIVANNVFSATFYVKPGGNDSADGKSHSTAWKTIAKVNAYPLQTGEDVYFLADGAWNMEQLVIDWNGTDSNRVIVGAYHMKNGKETVGVAAGTSKPRIIGSYTGKCSGAAGSCINVNTAVPAKAYSGLVQINANYVTFQNIRVQNSAGRGVALGNGYHHAILENNEVYYTAGNSTIFNRGSSYNILRNNDLSLCAIGWKHGDWVAVSKTWPTCNSAVSSHHNIFEGNYVHESYGEGIVMLGGAHTNIVRKNTLAAIRSANIYMDNGYDNIVENNILIGDRDGEFTRGTKDDGHKYGGGISVKVEDYNNATDAVNNIVRNNLLVRTGGLLMGLEPAAEQKGLRVGVKFLNNTLVETSYYLSLNDGTQFYDSRTEIANNIFVGSPSGSAACNITPANIDLHHNLWDVAQAKTKCAGTSGDKVGDPRLRRTNWDAVSAGNHPVVTDFMPRDGSPAINSAVTQTSDVFTVEFDQANQLEGSCPLDLTEASQDFFCNSRDGQSDMGAIIIGVSNPSAVSIPFYMNVGGGAMDLSKTYQAEEFLISSGSSVKTTTAAIAGTADDAVYQNWRANNGSLSWSIPIANGNYDLSLLYQEHYWGVTEGLCTAVGSSRQFDVSVEGVLVRDEFDICALSGSSLTAVRDVIPNISVTDGQLDIKLSLGQGQDPKPQLMGLEITTAAPVPSPPGSLMVR